MTASELWAVFFRYLTDKARRGKINEILEIDEGIAMASEVLMTISRDEAERARLMSEFKYETDTQSKIGYARKEGRKEGRVEGRKEGRQEGRKEGRQEGRKEGRTERDMEIARNLKADGDSAEYISLITGLSLEEIARL
jgi:predicted transposase YdaD